jgi:hypothetical protein
LKVTWLEHFDDMSNLRGGHGVAEKNALYVRAAFAMQEIELRLDLPSMAAWKDSRAGQSLIVLVLFSCRM